jgi:hypothetical protein
MARNQKKTARPQEAVTVRIDPGDRWLLELISRAQHMATSSAFAWCVQVAGRLVDATNDLGSRSSLLDVALSTWDGNDFDRLLSLGHNAPGLMDHEQRAVFEAIRRSPELLKSDLEERLEGEAFDPNNNLQVAAYSDHDFLQENFEALKRIALDQASMQTPPPITRAQILDFERADEIYRRRAEEVRQAAQTAAKPARKKK